MSRRLNFASAVHPRRIARNTPRSAGFLRISPHKNSPCRATSTAALFASNSTFHDHAEWNSGVHDLAIDSHGNLYAGEVDNGKRVQKFVRN